MKVLPVSNYQTQNQNSKKQNVTFGSFKPIDEQDGEKALELVKTLAKRCLIRLSQEGDVWVTGKEADDIEKCYRQNGGTVVFQVVDAIKRRAVNLDLASSRN